MNVNTNKWDKPWTIEHVVTSHWFDSPKFTYFYMVNDNFAPNITNPRSVRKSMDDQQGCFGAPQFAPFSCLFFWDSSLQQRLKLVKYDELPYIRQERTDDQLIYKWTKSLWSDFWWVEEGINGVDRWPLRTIMSWYPCPNRANTISNHIIGSEFQSSKTFLLGNRSSKNILFTRKGVDDII